MAIVIGDTYNSEVKSQKRRSQMGRITVIFIALCLTMLCVACTTKPGGAGDTPKKVADQRLATYTPIRRLTYRNACGSEGPLTICVDRITLSESAALVEARIRNSSSERYVQGAAKEASVLLADNSGMTLAWSKVGPMEYPGTEEMVVHFRMEGHFSGEPYAVVLNSIRKKRTEHGGHGFSIVAMLGE